MNAVIRMSAFGALNFVEWGRCPSPFGLEPMAPRKATPRDIYSQMKRDPWHG